MTRSGVGASLGAGPRSSDTPASDADAQATRTPISAHRIQRLADRDSWRGPSSGCTAEAAANIEARKSPTGVAITKPLFGS
jgi:hypothetical protein